MYDQATGAGATTPLTLRPGPARPAIDLWWAHAEPVPDRYVVARPTFAPPFDHRVTPIGRARETEQILAHIASRHHGHVGLWGPLGLGKTHLLRAIAAGITAASPGGDPPELMPVYVDLQAVAPFSAGRFWQRVAHLAERQAPALAPLSARLAAREALDIADVESYLDSLARRGTTLVLLLDEFEWVLQVGSTAEEAASRDFLAQLASLARRTPRELALIVATERPLAEVIEPVRAWRGSPFAMLFQSVGLHPLPLDAADDLLAGLMEDHGAGHPLSRAELRAVSAAAGGYPAAIEAAAIALALGQAPGSDGIPPCSHAEAAAAAKLAGIVRPDPPGAAALDDGTSRHAGSTATTRLRVDERCAEVWLDGQRLAALTALEFSLLALLCRRPGHVHSRVEILSALWGEESAGADDETRVEKLVSRLRQKIEVTPDRARFIRTARGRGYRYVPQP